MSHALDERAADRLGLRALFGSRARAREQRETAAELAAVEAAEEDPSFAADVVKPRAAELFLALQRAWSTNDVDTLRRLVGEELMVEWEERLSDFRAKGWRNVVDVLEGPEVHYVGVTNRAGDQEDRVVVEVSARLRDVVVDRYGSVLPNEEGEVARIREYWTLAKRGGEWVVASIEQEQEGAHQLSEPLVSTPDRDDTRLHAEAVMEVASEDEVEVDQVGELLSPAFSGSARAAALDLSLLDGRFAPDVLATAVGEVVDAWAEAIDGPDEPLAAHTSTEALRAMLYPTGSDRARLVIRGLAVNGLTITDLTPGPPPEVRLELEVEGVQYVEDRATTEVVAGSRRRRTTTRQVWRLRLTDTPRTPWVVVAAEGVVPA